eukprot:2299998-Amphidinium_carterae.1
MPRKNYDNNLDLGSRRDPKFRRLRVFLAPCFSSSAKQHALNYQACSKKQAREWRAQKLDPMRYYHIP